jgi:pyruvate/2-oxoglutarate dehydrogenase complex dihydrolipoamide acyltransferase (E2) component
LSTESTTIKERLAVKYSREVEHTMAVEIKMPQLSDTMNDGKIIEWRVKEGQQVSRGDILAEVETDKANLEIECFHQGILLKIMTPAEHVAKVGQVIAVIGEQGDAVGTPHLSHQAQPAASQASAPVSSQTPISAGTTAPVTSVQSETVVHKTYSNGNSLSTCSKACGGASN